MTTPYSGNVDTFPATVAVPSGSDTPSSALFATADEGNADRGAWLKVHAPIGPLLTWSPAAPGWPLGIGPYAMCFNDQPTAQDWIVLEYGNVASQWAAYHGVGDGNWIEVGSDVASGTPPSGLCVTSAGVIWVTTFGATNLAQWSSPGYGSNFTAATGTTVSACTDYRIAALGSVVVGAVGTSTSGTAQLGITSSSGFASHATGITTTKWLLRSNGSQAIAVPITVGGTGIAAYYTSDGVTWTGVSVTTSIFQPEDLAWDSVRHRWVLITSFFHVYVSSDGITWTQLTTTITTPSLLPVSLACVMGNYFALLTTSTSDYQLAASYDGITWTLLTMFLRSPSGASGALFAAPAQLGFAPLVNPASGSPAATNTRFSGICALGDAPL